MNWGNFFQDNAQSLFTLGGVFLGSLITFLINYFNNRFQAKEKEKDRDEQKREAKIQDKKKWIEHDILELIGLLNTLVQLSSKFSLTADKGKFLIDSHEFEEINNNEELSKLAKEYNKDLEIIHDELLLTSDNFNSVVISFQEDEELMKVHKIFGDILRSVTPYRTIYELTKNEVDAHVNVGIVSGLCRKALRDKLISIRDTE